MNEPDFAVRQLSHYQSEDLETLYFQICNRITDIRETMKESPERERILKNLDVWLYRLRDANSISKKINK